MLASCDDRHRCKRSGRSLHASDALRHALIRRINLTIHFCRASNRRPWTHWARTSATPAQRAKTQRENTPDVLLQPISTAAFRSYFSKPRKHKECYLPNRGTDQLSLDAGFRGRAQEGKTAKAYLKGVRIYTMGSSPLLSHAHFVHKFSFHRGRTRKTPLDPRFCVTPFAGRRTTSFSFHSNLFS